MAPWRCETNPYLTYNPYETQLPAYLRPVRRPLVEVYEQMRVMRSELTRAIDRHMDRIGIYT